MVGGLTFLARFSMIGELLGNYRILAKLGSGSMGVVFLAEHQRLARRVAIKLLAAELVRDQQVLQRFFNEALATSMIRHPGIVDVSDCDVDASGRAYIVMELLEGETLGERLERGGGWIGARRASSPGRWPRRSGRCTTRGSSTATSSRKTCSWCATARNPTAVAVKVLDFGVAKLLAHDAATRLTMRGMMRRDARVHVSGAVRGIGRSITGPTSTRWDASCSRCSRGLPPFVADTVQELLSAHRFFPAPPLTSSGVAVPPWLAELLARMLAKEPGQRPVVDARGCGGDSGARGDRKRSRRRRGAAPEASDDPVVERRAGLRRFGARRAAIAFALASAVVLAGAVWRAQRRPVRSAHANPAPVAERVVNVEPPAVPVVAATRPAEVVVPVPPAAVAPTSLERRPERATRAARPARPAASQPRSVDADGIVDL